MADSARKVLADNLARLMKASPDLDSRAKIAKRSGVALGAVSNMASPDDIDPKTHKQRSVPTLTSIEKVAKAYDLEVWQLMSPGLELTDPPVIVGKDQREMLDGIRTAVEKQIAKDAAVVKKVASETKVARLIGRVTRATLFNDDLTGPPKD